MSRYDFEQEKAADKGQGTYNIPRPLSVLSNGISRLISAHVLLVLLAVVAAAVTQGTPPKKLPSAEKIVSDYLKAIGGKKVTAAQRDATCDWIVNFNNRPIGVARTIRKAPASERLELTFGNGQIVSATNARSAWELGIDKHLRTLTTLEAATAKLQATLAASHLVDFKKANVLARVVSLADLASEPVYIVEFSTRSGARVQYYFSVKSKLITKITSDTKKSSIVFEDYRSEQGLLEPHQVRMSVLGPNDVATDSGTPPTGEITLVLQTVKHNTGVDDQLFDPPARVVEAGCGIGDGADAHGRGRLAAAVCAN